MKAVVVIPARYGSTRFPGKPLADLDGKPLIEHVYRRACLADVEDVIVATDDRRIEEAVLGFGGRCVMTGSSHRSGSDRLGEVARGLDAGIIVNVQGDEPLIDPEVIDAVIAPLRGAAPPDIATVAVPINDNDHYGDRHVVKVVTDSEGTALYFSRSPIPHGWKPGEGAALRHVGIYAYTKESLLRFVTLSPGKLEVLEDLEQLRALENGMRIAVVTREGFTGIGVDRPEDLERVLKIMLEETF
ncbi:MAG: 3-deoxy-manno-octulosonate cytidylyltransferase [bacterium]|nr:3-deoxy-manno-octulosonate cytidylyltransferase [bacterium]